MMLFCVQHTYANFDKVFIKIKCQVVLTKKQQPSNNINRINAVSITVYVSLIMHYFVRRKTCKGAYTKPFTLRHRHSNLSYFLCATPPVLQNFQRLNPFSLFFPRFIRFRNVKRFICARFYSNA